MNRIERMLQELCPEGVEYRKLGEVLDYEQPTKYIVKDTGYDDSYQTPVLTAGQSFILGYTNEQNGIYEASKDNPTIIFDDFTCSFHWVDFSFKVKSSAMKMLRPINGKRISFKYVYYAMACIGFIPIDHARHWISKYSLFEIPVPPLPIQEEIVRILEHFTELAAELQAELQARQEQYEYYNNRLLSFDDDIPKMKLNDVVTFMNGKGHEKYIEDQGAYIVVNSKFISTAGKVIKYSNSQISPLYKDMILMVMSDLPNGKALAKCFVVDADNKYTLNQRIGAFTIRDKNLITTRFLYYILDRNKQLLSYDNGADQTNLRKGDILNIIIPVPPLSEQQRIVSILDKFETLVNDLSQGLPAEITAVQEQYEYYRNKLLTFNRIKSN